MSNLAKLAAWERLGGGSDLASVADLDPEGMKIARNRDNEISNGVEETITREQFLRRISGTQ